MSFKKLSGNRTVVPLLLATYVAVESYFLNLIAVYALGGFWLSNVLFHILAVFGAYVIIDTILHSLKGSLRKRAIIASSVLLGTIVVAVVLAVVMLYLRKLQLHAALH